MKHLKRFNEDIEWPNKSEVEELCKESLAYLLDKGYSFRVFKYNDVNYGHIIFNAKQRNNIAFKWSDIKDDFIPFLEMLIIKYGSHNGDGTNPDDVNITVTLHTGTIKHSPNIGQYVVPGSYKVARSFTGDDIKKILDDKLISRANIVEIRINYLPIEIFLGYKNNKYFHYYNS